MLVGDKESHNLYSFKMESECGSCSGSNIAG